MTETVSTTSNEQDLIELDEKYSAQDIADLQEKWREVEPLVNEMLVVLTPVLIEMMASIAPLVISMAELAESLDMEPEEK